MIAKPERRLRSETVSFTLNAGTDDDPKLHKFHVQLAYAKDTDCPYCGKRGVVPGVLREIAFVTRGKIGQGLDLMLSDLGIKLSRAIQGRTPDTGEVEV